MLRYIKFVLALTIFSANGIESAKILAVFPTPSISHQVVFRPLVQELAKRGHDVTIVTTDPVFPKGRAPRNLTEIDVHDMSYKLWSDFLKTSTGSQDDLYTQIKVALTLIGKVFVYQMETEEVQAVLKKRNYDLLMVEALARPALALAHIYQVPLIQVSSFGAVMGNYENMGAPVHPILYPSLFRQKIVNLTFWEKVSELYNHYSFVRLLDSMVDSENELVHRLFGPDVPCVTTLGKYVDMLFLNVHPIFESNRPVPPSVIYMGGLHQNPVKELPNELKNYLDSSKNGVIYISFGTNVNPSQLPKERTQILTSVFSKLPYDILWKWDKDELPGRTENIRISKWLPQSDLLRHPKIKLFITQGGLQSTDEAITAGVPLIGVPMLGDQWYNVEQYRRHKIGLRLDMESLTEEQFRNAIETVIEDKSYRQNVIKLRTLMRDQPQTPLQRAIWWTEYVLRHKGAKHLRSPAANISWAEYLELELVVTLLLFAVISFSALGLVLYLLCNYVRRNFMVDVKLKPN